MVKSKTYIMTQKTGSPTQDRDSYHLAINCLHYYPLLYHTLWDYHQLMFTSSDGWRKFLLQTKTF